MGRKTVSIASVTIINTLSFKAIGGSEIFFTKPLVFVVEKMTFSHFLGKLKNLDHFFCLKSEIYITCGFFINFIIRNVVI